MGYIQKFVTRILTFFGYTVIESSALESSQNPDFLGDISVYTVIKTSSLKAIQNSGPPGCPIPTLPGIVFTLQQQQSRSQPPISGYQLMMASYDLRTGMSNLDPEFFPLYERCCAYTMTSWQRLYSLYTAVHYIVDANIPGVFLECGVWRGGSMMMVALTLQALGQGDRQLLLFDTYEGLPKPDEHIDVDVWGNRGIDGWRPHRRSDKSSNWAYASLEDVHTNIESTGYPMDKVSLVKGMVEETLPQEAPETIAMLRLDTDWYSSTRHELQHLYPRLAHHGILIIDDYGHFKGARKATDDYFRTEATSIPFLSRVDYSGRIGVKI
jgi:hypothetical protein